MAKTAKKVISFGEKRGIVGSVTHDKQKLQVMCACNGNYTKETRKLKTIPVDVRAVAGDAFNSCEECGTMPYIVLPKKAGELALFNWRGKPTKSLEKEANK